MVREQEWIKQKLAEIEGKRAMLKMLEETLSKWEEEVDWEAIPEEKQAVLIALAKESVGTLDALIRRLGSQIQEGIAEIDEEAGRDGSG